MNKKIVVSIALIVIFIILFVVINNSIKKTNNKEENIILETEDRIVINSENGYYEIKDIVSGEVIVSRESKEEAEAEFEFYKRHPEYRFIEPNLNNEE